MVLGPERPKRAVRSPARIERFSVQLSAARKRAMYCKRLKGVHNRENETGRNQSQVGLLWLLVER